MPIVAGGGLKELHGFDVGKSDGNPAAELLR
jgi:hypothetical protein